MPSAVLAGIDWLSIQNDIWKKITTNLRLKMGGMVSFTLSFLESIMKTCSVVLTFESVDEILWCDHSNETSLAVLLHGTICYLEFLGFYFWHYWE